MIDDKHGHRIKAMLEQHGVAVRSELYGRTTAFRLVLLSAETSLTAAPAAADAAGTCRGISGVRQGKVDPRSPSPQYERVA